jgi:hypothetical protein
MFCVALILVYGLFLLHGQEFFVKLYHTFMVLFFFFFQFCEVGGLPIIHKGLSQIWLRVKEES